MKQFTGVQHILYLWSVLFKKKIQIKFAFPLLSVSQCNIKGLDGFSGQFFRVFFFVALLLLCVT